MDVTYTAPLLPELRPQVPAHAGQTLVDVLRRRAVQTPDRLAISLTTDKGAVATFTYGELDRHARALAQRLQQQRCVGARALIMLPPGPDYLVALLGCWYARVTAVPISQPSGDLCPAGTLRLIDTVGARILIYAHAARQQMRQAAWRAVSRTAAMIVNIDSLPLTDADAWLAPDVQPHTLALLQFAPTAADATRGVRIQHGNLMAGLQTRHQAMAVTPEDIAVACLPADHPMHLTRELLQPLYSGYPAHLLCAGAVAQRPWRWLETICARRATLASAPAWLYARCSTEHSERSAPLDLSCWRLAATGDELLPPAAMAAFDACFTPMGWPGKVFFTAYEPGESSGAVTASTPHRPPHRLVVDRDQLDAGRLQPAASGQGIVLLSSGMPVAQATLCIVDPHTREPLREGQVGEIWVAGPTVADGYWKNPEATWENFQATLRDGERRWLRTGDRGAMLDHHLYTLGRLAPGPASEPSHG